MRRKTFAYNSVIIGVLVGILVYVSTESLVLGILTCVAVSVVGFVLIRLLEKAINKGTDKMIDAASNAINKRKQEKNDQ